MKVMHRFSCLNDKTSVPNAIQCALAKDKLQQLPCYIDILSHYLSSVPRSSSFSRKTLFRKGLTIVVLAAM